MNRREVKITKETIGWVGALIILVAYALLSFNILSSKDLAYQIMNGLGSIGIIYTAFRRKDYQPLVLNIIWTTIAIITIIIILI